MENDKKVTQDIQGEEKADNQSVYDEPTVQKQTPKDGKHQGESYTNTITPGPGTVEHDGVDKV